MYLVDIMSKIRNNVYESIKPKTTCKLKRMEYTKIM